MNIMAKLKTLKDKNDEVFYPLTHLNAVIGEQGKNAGEILAELESKTLKFKNISTDANALKILSAIVDCKIWTKQEFREVGISAFGEFNGKFVIYISASDGTYLGQIETNPMPIDASCICGNMKKGVTSYNNNISVLNK